MVLAAHRPGWWPEVLQTGDLPWCFSTHSCDSEDVGDELGQGRAGRSSWRFPAEVEEPWSSGHSAPGRGAPLQKMQLLEVLIWSWAPQSSGFILVLVEKPTVPHLLSQLPGCCFLCAALQAWRDLQSLFQRLGRAPQRLGTAWVTHAAGTDCVAMEKAFRRN